MSTTTTATHTGWCAEHANDGGSPEACNSESLLFPTVRVDGHGQTARGQGEMHITQLAGEQQPRIWLSIQEGDELTLEQAADLGQHLLAYVTAANDGVPLYEY